MWTGEEKSIIATAALTNMDPTYKLDFWQDWYLKSNERFLIVNKSRRIGWSYITSGKAVIEASSKSVFKYQQVFVSYGMNDAVGKISDARNFLMNIPERWRKPILSDSKTALEFWDEGRKSKSQLISIPNRTLRGYGTSNPFGGISLDEFAFHKDDDKVYVSALPCLVRGGLLAIGSTPETKTGKFYDILSDKQKYPEFLRKDIPWWWASALCIDVKRAIVEAPGMTTHQRVETFGTPIIKMELSSLSLPQFQQEFECQFTDESDAFISLEMIGRCTPEKVEQYEYQNISEFLNGIVIPEICIGLTPNGDPIFESVYAPAYDPEIHGSLYAGMDIGRTKDSSIFTIIGVKDGMKHVWMSYELKKTRFDEQRKFVELAMGSLPIRRLNVDRTGLGMEFSEWAETKFPKIAEGVQFTNEIKEDLANKMYLGFERLEFILPMNRQLHADIHCIRKTTTLTKHSRYDGSTKDSHADRFWSMALANISINDTSGRSRLWSEYSKRKKTDKTEKVISKGTGNSDLDRLKRKIRSQNRRNTRGSK